MEFGEECTIENATVSVLGGMKIITDLNPQNNNTDVDVFAIPQAAFAFRVNEPIVIPEENNENRIYKIIVDKFSIVDEKGKEIKGKISYGKTEDVADFYGGGRSSP